VLAFTFHSTGFAQLKTTTTYGTTTAATLVYHQQNAFPFTTVNTDSTFGHGINISKTTATSTRSRTAVARQGGIIVVDTPVVDDEECGQKKSPFLLQHSPLFQRKESKSFSSNVINISSPSSFMNIMYTILLRHVIQSTPVMANPLTSMNTNQIIQSTYSKLVTCLSNINLPNLPNLQQLVLPLLLQQQERKKVIFKFILFLGLLYTTTSILWDTIQTTKRQSIDPTSEWSRFAQYPIRRGRALSFLLFKVMPYMMFAKLLDLILPKSIQQRFPNTASPTLLRQKAGQKFANGLLTLGPLYIKIGQILSCRENVLPNEWADGMARLQDCVPAKSGVEALELAYDAYGGQEKFERIFVEFDDVPIAAASLGQVHRAKLRRKMDDGVVVDDNDGQEEIVAIKLQRGRLREIYDRYVVVLYNILLLLSIIIVLYVHAYSLRLNDK